MGSTSLALAEAAAPHHLSGSWLLVCPLRVLRSPPTGLNHTSISGLAYPSPSPPASQRTWWCRNINLLPIAYALRPRLRIRLTLGGLALPRKPEVYGEPVSHRLYRYLWQHNHFQYLQQPSRSTFTGDWKAPLPTDGPKSIGSAASVTCLSPVEFSAQERLTSELLRFL